MVYAMAVLAETCCFPVARINFSSSSQVEGTMLKHHKDFILCCYVIDRRSLGGAISK